MTIPGSVTPRHGRATRPTALVLALAAAGLAQPALAQSADDKETQTIVITSNKRPEPQREVAGTVSVLPGGDLERRGARDQEDVFKLTPGVQVNRGDPGNNTVTIRGLGTQAAVEGGGLQQQPTGFYLEDVPLNAPIGKGLILDVLPFDLDRVEVLRGPQGALFGSGSLGGAVRYLFARPDAGALGAAVQGGFSKVAEGGSAASIYGMVNAPLSKDVAAVRVVAYDRTDPGYIDNLGNGVKDANEVRQTGGRVLVGVKPARGLALTLTASTQKVTTDDASYVFGDRERLEHDNPELSSSRNQLDFLSLGVDVDLGAVMLTSITGHWKTKASTRGDDTQLFASIGLPLPVVSRTTDGDSRATSQELRVASKPGGDLAWVAGVFYQSSKSHSVGKQSDPSAAFGVVDLVDLTTDSEGSEKAVFFDSEFRLGGGWSAGLGGRYYKTTTHYVSRGTVFGAPSDSTPPDGDDSGTTPKVTLKYRFGDSLWYALASKGYRYGGVNASPPFSTYKSDSLWNYETGLRLAPMAGLQVDVSAFVLDWKDAQFTYFDASGPLPFSGVGNVGKARSTGLETALRYRASQALDFGAAVAYIDARTKKDVDSLAGRTPITIAAGSRLPGTAHLQTALQAGLRFAGPLDTQGRFNVTHSHVGQRTMDLAGFYSAPGYNSLDLGLEIVKDSWKFAAGLTNATDSRGIMSITGTPDGSNFQQYYLQRPRTLNLSVRYDL